jgi:hypothetical protein
VPIPAGPAPGLFTIAELATWLHRTVDATFTAQATLAHDLTLDEFTKELGAGVLTDPPQAGVKGLALQVAARVVLNPGAVKSETTGPMSVTWGTATGVALTADERAQLRRCVGLTDSTSTPPVKSVRMRAGLAPQFGDRVVPEDAGVVDWRDRRYLAGEWGGGAWS